MQQTLAFNIRLGFETLARDNSEVSVTKKKKLSGMTMISKGKNGERVKTE